LNKWETHCIKKQTIQDGLAGGLDNEEKTSKKKIKTTKKSGKRNKAYMKLHKEGPDPCHLMVFPSLKARHLVQSQILSKEVQIEMACWGLALNKAWA